MTNKLFEKFRNLKVRIGGNRELQHYEETFGMTKEEAEHITMPARYIVRILSETEFAIRLSEASEQRYDDIIDRELDLLLRAMEEDGCLTRAVCKEAEQILMPMAGAAKEYKLILAGHAHIDMNWMWSWQETVAATVATFTTVLKLMEDYPQFCFSQSQTSVYKIIDDYAPELHDQIKARIDEGRWEVTSSAWVETDKNMPNTESLLRHIAYSKKYLKEKWGIDPDRLEIDFSPDTFGHSANIPEIDAYGGVKYYYHCRALDGNMGLYRWRGLSGREMLAYREEYWYNSAISPKPALGLIETAKRCAGLKTGLAVYGVGDHGGGPTRRDVERGLEMQQWPVFPTIRFGTFAEFFHEAEAVREQLPLIDRELNFVFAGCYSTQSRIKLGNRRAEAALSEAETANTFAVLQAGAKDAGPALEKAWQNVLFTHFHDILTGSCVQDSREHAMGLFQNAMATANTETSLALNRLSAMTDTSAIVTKEDPDAQSEGAGVGYRLTDFAGRPAEERGQGLTRIWTVFNNTPASRTEPVEITVWDWTGNLRNVRVTDAEGCELPFQLLDITLQHYWDHKYFRFLAYVTVPAFAYTTVVLTQGEQGAYPFYMQNPIRSDHPDRNPVLENGLVRAEFDFTTGMMISFMDLESGREWLSAPACPAVVETDRSRSDAWHIGSWLSKHPLTQAISVHPSANGELLKGIKVLTKFNGSEVTVEYSLAKGARCVKAAITADWSLTAGETVPVLIYQMPTSAETDRFVYNIPGGVLTRDAAHMDRPALSFIRAKTEDKLQPAIVTDCKYGFRGYDESGKAVLVSTLIHPAGHPDPYPERGIHHITLSLGLLPSDPVASELEALRLNRPLTPVSATRHAGPLSPKGNFLTVSTDAAVISAVMLQEGRTVVRFYSVSDSEAPVTVDFGLRVRDAYAVDLAGRKIGDATVDGSTVTVSIGAHCIAGISIAF